MPTHPEPEVLYPDVVAAGGLAAALRAILTVPVVGSDTVYHATVPTVVPHRRALAVSASHVERRWFVRGNERDQDLALVGGDTRDLGPIARAALAWHDGTALADIPKVAPFVTLTGRIEVPDGDPARLVESEWQHLRVGGGRFPEFVALVEAAYAEPSLRRLYPYTSHWTLRFATRTRPALSHDVAVCVHPGLDGTYRVTLGYLGPELGRTGDAREAVSVAVSHLPAGLGPVVYGSPTVRR